MQAPREEAPRCGGPPCCGVSEGLSIPFAALGGELILIVGEEDLRVFEVADHLQPVDGVVIVLDAVVEPGRIAVQVLLHPDRVLRQDERLPAAQLDLHRLMAERVARRAENRHGAVAEQIVIALELEVVEVTGGTVEVRHHEHAALPLELLGPPRLVQLLLLDDVDRLREELDVADVVQVSVRGDHGLHLVGRVPELLQLHVDDVVTLLTWLEEDRKSTRLNSSHTVISYAVFCLKKKNNTSSDNI